MDPASNQRASRSRALAAGWLVLLAVLPVEGMAGPRRDTIFKCLRPGGSALYQDRPCPKHTRPAGERSVADASVAVSGAAVSAEDPEYLARLAGRYRGRAAVHAIPARTTRCERTRARRAAAEARAGHDLDFEARRRWNDRVYEACK